MLAVKKRRELNEQKKQLKKEYEDKKKQILNSDHHYQEFLREAWKPEKYKYELDLKIQELKQQRKQGLIIATDEQYEEEVQKARETYNKNMKSFISGKGAITEIQQKYENADAILTATEKVSIYNFVLNNNILIFGGSGCGKTRTFCIPNILQAHSSFVITDPKGEILAKIGYFLEKIKGYKIRVLNLDEPTHSDCYNPFAYIHPEREGYEERVLTLIETLIMNTNGGENQNSSDPFWDKAERCFLQALFFFTCVDFKKEQRTINTFLKLLSWLELEEENDKKNSRLDVYVNEFAQRHGENHIGVQQYREFRGKSAGKTAKSIVMSVVARFAPFRTKEIKRILSADSMNLENLGEEKTAIFVVVPPTNNTFNFMAGMLFTQMFQELQYCATQKHKADGQKLPVPVRFLLDEFATTCKIPRFQQIIAYARSLGIGICPIIQSLEQLKEMFEKSWGVIVDNCNSMLYLGNVTSPETLEYLVKLVGKGTFDKKSTSRTRGKSSSSSTSYDKIGRDLLDMSEIRTLPKDECLLIVGGRPPFWSKKFDYTSHPNYKYTSDANSKFYYDYVPIEVEIDTNKVSLKKEEKEQTIKEKAKKRTLAILAGIDKNLEKIELSLNPTELINQFAENKGRLAVIENEDFTNGSYKNDLSDNELLVDYLFANESYETNLVATLIDTDGEEEENAELSHGEIVEVEEHSHGERVEIQESDIEQINGISLAKKFVENVSEMVAIPNDEFNNDSYINDSDDSELSSHGEIEEEIYTFIDDEEIEMPESMDGVVDNLNDLMNEVGSINSD